MVTVALGCSERGFKVLKALQVKTPAKIE